MKKTMWIAVGMLAASVVAASAQEVLSANAVGYIKKTLPANAQLIAVSIPLDNMNETNNVFGRTSIAQEMPTGSEVFFWDEGQQGWSGGAKGTKGWSSGLSNKVVYAGEAFFVKGATGDIDREVTITGEVPADATLQRAMAGGGSLSAVANPYPVDFVFGQSTLAGIATTGSEVFFWDEVNQGWSGGAKGTKGWSAGISNRTVVAGEGFFMKEAGTVTSWNQAKPYTWP